MDIDWKRIDSKHYRDSIGLLSSSEVCRRVGGNSKTLAEQIRKNEVPPPDFQCVGLRKMNLWYGNKIRKRVKTKRMDLIIEQIGYIPIKMDGYQKRFARDVWGFIRLMEGLRLE